MMTVKQYAPLFKTTFEKDGKQLVSYQPKSKKSNYEKWFPIGLGNYEEVEDEVYGPQKNYEKNFWVNAKMGEWGKVVVVTLNATDTEEYQTLNLERKENDYWKYFGASQPKTIAGKQYRVNLYKNNKKDKPNDLLLIFTEAESQETTGMGSWSEQEIDFELPNNDDIPDF